MSGLTPRRFLSFFLAATGILLSSCAPRQTPGTVVTARTEISGVSFYPHEAGLVWAYLPEGDTSRDVPYALRTLGPTYFQGQPVVASQLTGRGADQTWYRTYEPSGVWLQGIRKPGVTISLSPAWQEAPAENLWRVGLSWEGSSKITITDDGGKVQGQGSMTYRYVVQDRRQVSTLAGNFNVWVVTRELRDDLGGLFPAAQQYWFVPFVGEVRTPENLLMTGRNFSLKAGGK